MITSMDKAVVALLGLIGFAAERFFGVTIIDAGVMTTLTTVLTPLLVWLIPNKTE